MQQPLPEDLHQSVMLQQTPPGPKGLAVLFHRLHAYYRFLDFLERMADRYGPLIRLDAKTYLINTPDLIEEVLIKASRVFLKTDYEQLHEAVAFWGNGLPVNHSESWLKHRRLIQTAFSPEQLLTYGVIIGAHAQQGAARWANGAVPDLFAEMVNLTWANSVRNFVGPIDQSTGAIIRSGIESTLYLLDNPTQLQFALATPDKEAFRKHLPLMNAALMDLIQAARSEPLRDTLLSRLVHTPDEDGALMSDRQVRDELVTMLRAGHKNTAITLTWALYLLAQHPQVEARLHAELRARLGTRPPAPEDQQHLPYTQAVINETMRLYPLYPIIDRVAQQDYPLGGYTIPSGASIMASSWLMQRSPAHFADPKAFKPERWLDQSTHKLPKFAYFPFGGGPRICNVKPYALMESVLTLASLVQRYQCRLAGSKPVKPFVSFNGLRINDPLSVVFTPR